MTGGRVVVLGPTGRNFAAGMSGGTAFVLDTAGDFAKRCNLQMVSVAPPKDPDELLQVKGLIERHVLHTGSAVGRRVLEDFASAPFLRVMPNDYRRMLDAQAKMRARGLPEDEAEMAAFEQNVLDDARAAGN
jgi:glutamate synthase (NADPH/NADH) large chain